MSWAMRALWWAIKTSPAQRREGDRPPKSGWWRGRAPSAGSERPRSSAAPVACPLHHALCGAWFPSRRVAGEVAERRWRPSEVALLLLLLHGGRLVLVDHPALPLGGGGQQHLLDDLRQGVGGALDGPGQRVAALGAEADRA